MKKLLLSLIAVMLILGSCCNKCEKSNEMKMNTTMEDLLTRRSVRSYTDEVPPMDVIEEICKAGTYAPTVQHQHDTDPHRRTLEQAPADELLLFCRDPVVSRNSAKGINNLLLPNSDF